MRLSARQGRKFYTLVDREDFQRVIDQTWRFDAGYASSTKDGSRLHSFILKAKPGQIIDHINGDRLDNRKQNLRFVTPAENAKNCTRPTFPGKTSRFKGVCWDFRRGHWFAGITSDGVHHRLGVYSDEAEAARAYDEAAKRLHGEFARTNEMMKLFEMADPFVSDCSRGPNAISRRQIRKRMQYLPKGSDPLTGNVYHSRFKKAKRDPDDLSHLDAGLRKYYASKGIRF